MAGERYTRTNQKIFFAGLLLDDYARLEQERSGAFLARQQALQEAIIFHLHGALLGLCHEISGYYRLAAGDVTHASMLINAQALAREPGPELAELVELASDSHSWLARLLKAYSALFEPPQQVKASKVAPSVVLIESVSLEPEVPAVDEALLRESREQLKQLALRFRESMTEC